MAAASIVAPDYFRTLPKATQAKLNLVGPAERIAAAHVKDDIQAFYQDVWQLAKALHKKKESRGICAGGRASCMVSVGRNAEDRMCSSCRRFLQTSREATKNREPRRLSAISEYAQMRRKEREAARLERAR